MFYGSFIDGKTHFETQLGREKERIEFVARRAKKTDKVFASSSAQREREREREREIV